MNNKTLFSSLFVFLVALFMNINPVFATNFDLIPPAGTLERGQDITFTINIDTEGVAVTSIQSGLTYDSQLLQYVSVTAGAAMTSVVADTTTHGTGKVLFTGANAAGFNGTGVFATVVFKIIAQSAGSTEICSLWLPTPTATPGPTSVIPTSPPVPTLPPQPTALPQTGITDSRNTAVVVAFAFVAAAGGVFYLSQKQKYSLPHPSKKHIAHHQTHGKSS
jgi:LPXTG-motif cell wall-anchored protein